MIKAMKMIMQKLFYNCEEATLLIEKKASAESLEWLTCLRLKGHLAMCKWCSAYSKKVTLMDRAMRRIPGESAEVMEEAERVEFQERLKRACR